MRFKKSKPNSLNQFGIQLLSNSASFHCILVFCVAVSQEISCLIRLFLRVLSLQSRRGILWAVGISKKSMANCSMVCLNFRWYLWKFLRRHFVYFRISIHLGKISPGFNFLLLYVFVSVRSLWSPNGVCNPGMQACEVFSRFEKAHNQIPTGMEARSGPGVGVASVSSHKSRKASKCCLAWPDFVTWMW